MKSDVWKYKGNIRPGLVFGMGARQFVRFWTIFVRFPSLMLIPKTLNDLPRVSLQQLRSHIVEYPITSIWSCSLHTWVLIINCLWPSIIWVNSPSAHNNHNHIKIYTDLTQQSITYIVHSQCMDSTVALCFRIFKKSNASVYKGVAHNVSPWKCDRCQIQVKIVAHLTARNSWKTETKIGVATRNENDKLNLQDGWMCKELNRVLRNLWLRAFTMPRVGVDASELAHVPSNHLKKYVERNSFEPLASPRSNRDELFS